jgi:hypothetical protein
LNRAQSARTIQALDARLRGHDDKEGFRGNDEKEKPPKGRLL